MIIDNYASSIRGTCVDFQPQVRLTDVRGQSGSHGKALCMCENPVRGRSVHWLPRMPLIPNHITIHVCSHYSRPPREEFQLKAVVKRRDSTLITSKENELKFSVFPLQFELDNWQLRIVQDTTHLQICWRVRIFLTTNYDEPSLFLHFLPAYDIDTLAVEHT